VALEFLGGIRPDPGQPAWKRDTQIDVPIAAGQTFNGEPISGAVEPGTYDLLCTIHPTMTGQVTIVA
jgi:plastocyanin